MRFRPGKGRNPAGRKKGSRRDQGVAALAAKATPENIRWLEKARDSKRAPWAVKMKAVELLLAYGHGRPRDSIHDSGDAPDQADAAPGVFIYKSQQDAEAAAAAMGADVPTVMLPSNGYEVDPKRGCALHSGLAEDDDEDLNRRLPGSGFQQSR